MLDIPNYVTLPIEIGVAILILLMDRRQRKREAESIIRFQEQQKETRESEIRQRERFNNWAQESSKRQIMLLESIISTLDEDKVDDFKTEVGSRYAKEITQDMQDLDDLFDKKQKMTTDDPELEADIESKIEEIESGTDFIEHFLPKETLDQINKIADTAKSAYKELKDLPHTLENQFPEDPKSIKIKFDDHQFEVDPNNPEDMDRVKDDIVSKYKIERMKLFDSLNTSIKEAIDEVARTKDEVAKELNNFSANKGSTSKIVDAVKSSLMSTMGLDKIVRKDNKEKKADTESKDDASEDDEENHSENSENSH